MQPLVSIVTPSFNQGRFLRRTIDSVLSQDYPRIEYLVCDGGSTDESVNILQNYDERVRWHSRRDGGQSDAINHGLRQSRGDILAWLNSDDVLAPGAVRTAVSHFQTHPDWDLIYGAAQHIDENDGVIEDYPTADYDFGQLLQSCIICQPATFWRRSVVDRVGLLDESLHYAMDYEYWLRIDRAGCKLVHVPELLACSRLYPETKTLSARMEVYREILAVSRRHAGDASFSQYYAYWHHRCHERTGGWPAWLRALPHCHWWLANLHRRLYRLASA
ncbi:MAG TPA: glycosyltransferase family 2 protein [Gemmataceae bacterium]|nr:glycosyltransferase family 2 protein [Gemmataceae bacterium]